VTSLAKLSHPNVIRYYDNWLELKEDLSVANGDTGNTQNYILTCCHLLSRLVCMDSGIDGLIGV